MPMLEITRGPGRGRMASLPEGGGVIGRGESCTLRIDDAHASRAHAEIIHRGPGTYLLNDLGSANGTRLNGRRIGGPTGLAEGDDIEIGETVIRFRLRPTVSGGAEEVVPAEAPTVFTRMDARTLPALAGADAERADALRFLLDLARAAESADRPARLAAVLARGLAEAVACDRVFLLLNAGGAMTPVERPLEAHEKRLYRLPFSSTVVEEARSTGSAVLARPREEARFRQARSVGAGGIDSAICVPLFAGEDCLGALYLDRVEGGAPFAQTDLELATAAGVQSSVALLNLRRMEELRQSRDRIEAELTGPAGVLGQSERFREVFAFIERAAPTEAAVLVLGESGTGKELVARALHRESPRSDRAFVVVNCAALPETLAEAELFGHAKGAFTGAEQARPGYFVAADGGTIFLDEVGELPGAVQAKLLRVLESGEVAPVGEAATRRVDVRVVAATNRDLRAAAEAGAFRQDLFYRLNVLTVTLPPLRERGGDVRLLLEHFLDYYAARVGRPALRFSGEALRLALAYPWPGNVRELRNVVERVAILATGEEVTARELPPEIRGGGPPPAGGSAESGAPLRSLGEVEKAHILRVLEAAGGNKTKAAEVLGIDRSTLYARLRQYGVADAEA
jgi:transcriptional regulator with GAF, ATPase, and Fis domain